MIIRRVLCAVCISFILGAFLCSGAQSSLCVPALFIAAAVLFVLRLLIAGGKCKAYALLIFLALPLGALRMQSALDYMDSLHKTFDNREVTVTGFINSPITKHGSSISFFLRPEKIVCTELGELTFDKRIYVRTYSNVRAALQLKEGRAIVLKGNLSSAKSKDAFSFESYLYASNAYLTAEASSLSDLGYSAFSPLVAFREAVTDIASANLRGDAAALFPALIFGNRSFITSELEESFSRSGAAHLIAVSGFHVSLVLSALMFAMTFFFGKNRKARIIAIAAVILFTLICGATPSAVRSAQMCILYQAAFLTRKKADSFTALAAAVLFMTAINPFLIFSVSLLLSAVSVLGILLLTKPIKACLGFLPSKPGEAIAVCIAAQAATIPICAILFNAVPPFAVFANLIAVPLASLALYAGFAFALVCFIPYIGSVLGMFLSLILNLLAQAVHFFASFDAAAFIPDMPIEAAAAYYCLLLLLLALWHRKKVTALVCSVTVAVLGCSILFAAPHTRLDVISSGGRGYLVSNSGSYIFIDDGCKYISSVENLLSERGVYNIDALFITSDEWRVSRQLLESGRVNALYTLSALPKALASAADKGGCRVIALGSGALIGNVAVTSPDSVSVLFAADGRRFLLSMSDCYAKCDIIAFSHKTAPGERALSSQAHFALAGSTLLTRSESLYFAEVVYGETALVWNKDKLEFVK
ncbi:MAG: ComEC/Rec2 family competence protein [Clostridia bacterium]|nr:ComEC/Rec2 family competence protein [Clostridia bacterium]